MTKDQFLRRIVITDRGCWHLEGNTKPYGPNRTLHRQVCEWFRGPIPEGFEPDHRCNDPLCFNPQHLEPVSHATNGWRAHTRRRGQMHRKQLRIAKLMHDHAGEGL